MTSPDEIVGPGDMFNKDLQDIAKKAVEDGQLTSREQKIETHQIGTNNNETKRISNATGEVSLQSTKD